MAITINGTTGLSGVDGSAGTPALQGSDTNTGISFGTDEVNINTGGSTRATVDSSGRVGIGTTSPGLKFEVHSGTDNAAAEFVSTDARVNIGFADSGSTLYSGLSGVRVGADGDNLAIYTANSESARIDSSGNLKFNSGYGSVATAYGCRAWVNFNGGGTAAIRASGNVSSITDHGTADYTVNFTTAMPDANYVIAGGGFGYNESRGTGRTLTFSSSTSSVYNNAINASFARVTVEQTAGGTKTDIAHVHVAIFR